MRKLLFSVLLSFVLGAAISYSARADDPGGGDPTPTNKDCSYNGGTSCANPTQGCTLVGGTCTVNGSGQRWHDPDGDGCGCLV